MEAENQEANRKEMKIKCIARRKGTLLQGVDFCGGRLAEDGQSGSDLAVIQSLTTASGHEAAFFHSWPLVVIVSY